MSLSREQRQLNAQIALLIDHFHLTPSEVGHLTVRQVQELYCHARDERGGIRFPGLGFETPEQEEQALEAFLRGLGQAIDMEEARRAIRARHR